MEGFDNSKSKTENKIPNKNLDNSENIDKINLGEKNEEKIKKIK